MNYEKLFTPFTINKMRVKNRFVFSPMGTGSNNTDGTMTTEEIDYFEERARGGAGMLILGNKFVDRKIAERGGLLNMSYCIPNLTTLCQSVQRYGAKMCAQISCGTGKNVLAVGTQPIYSASPNPLFCDPNQMSQELTVEEIKDVMKSIATSTQIVVNSGFDAIEIHGHAGYLIDQFMSPIWNRRTDEYGGSFENRMRFPIQMVHTIRKVVGPNFPILYRIALDHRFPGGRTLDESMAIIQALEAAGVDALDIDAGSYETMDYVFPTTYLGDACMEYVCAPARRHVNIPLLNSGNHTPETALRLIESSEADFVMMGRPLIADPELPNKLKAGLREDIRPCLRCNEECIGRIFTRSTKISCSVNMQVLAEKRFKIEKTLKPHKVAIIGAGPAGLEAARVAALRGHSVTVYEKEHTIGGQLSAAATPTFKRQLRELVTWYGVQLKKLGVELKLNTAIEPDCCELNLFDEIIVATGAVPVTPPIPGIDGANVVSVIDAHKDKSLLKGNNIVICGGGLSGCDSALELASECGKNITIVEMLPQIGKDVFMINALSLIPMLNNNGVRVLTNSRITSIDKDGVHITSPDGDSIIPADTVIAAFGMKKNDSIAMAVLDKYPAKTLIIGDCDKVGKVGNAVATGFNAGMSI